MVKILKKSYKYKNFRILIGKYKSRFSFKVMTIMESGEELPRHCAWCHRVFWEDLEEAKKTAKAFIDGKLIARPLRWDRDSSIPVWGYVKPEPAE